MGKLRWNCSKKPARWGLRLILALAALWVVVSALHVLRLKDNFYASAIPGDPVHMGMGPRDIKSVLGKPNDTWVMEEPLHTSLLGNDDKFEMRPTGEVILIYQRPVLGHDAQFRYSYHKPWNRMNELSVIMEFSDFSQAVTAARKAADYARTVFEQKGTYSFQNLNDIPMDYRFTASRGHHTFMLDITVNYDDTDTSGQPYTVNLSQNYFN